MRAFLTEGLAPPHSHPFQHFQLLPRLILSSGDCPGFAPGLGRENSPARERLIDLSARSANQPSTAQPAANWVKARVISVHCSITEHAPKYRDHFYTVSPSPSLGRTGPFTSSKIGVLCLQTTSSILAKVILVIGVELSPALSTDDGHDEWERGESTRYCTGSGVYEIHRVCEWGWTMQCSACSWD